MNGKLLGFVLERMPTWQGLLSNIGRFLKELSRGQQTWAAALGAHTD